MPTTDRRLSALYLPLRTVTFAGMAEHDTVRWGILGTGRITDKLIEAFREARGSRLVAVASRSADRAQERAARASIARAYGSYEKLLQDSEIDVVLNALHNGLHCEWSIRALAAGKHVLCEKPLACSSDEVERMFGAARDHRRWLMEGFMFRFHPQMTELQRRLRAGEIGRIVHMDCHYLSRGRERDNLRYRREAGGGALMDLGCYCTDFLRWAAGIEPHRVSAQAHFDEITGVDLTLSGHLEFAGGLTGHFACSFEADGSYGAEIIGTEGTLLVPHPWRPPSWPAEFVLSRGGRQMVIRVEDDRAPVHALAPFILEIEHMAGCVRYGRPPAFPPDAPAEADSRANMRVLEAGLAAARAGAAVALGGACGAA